LIESSYVSKGDAEVYSINVSKYFASEKKCDREEMINWVYCQARNVRFTIVTNKSNSGCGRRKPKLVLDCERGGDYKGIKKILKREDTNSGKCSCPFMLRGYFSASKLRSLSNISGFHNHMMEPKLEGHMLTGRLNPKEKVLVVEVTRNMVK